MTTAGPCLLLEEFGTRRSKFLVENQVLLLTGDRAVPKDGQYPAVLLLSKQRQAAEGRGCFTAAGMCLGSSLGWPRSLRQSACSLHPHGRVRTSSSPKLSSSCDSFEFSAWLPQVVSGCPSLSRLCATQSSCSPGAGGAVRGPAPGQSRAVLVRLPRDRKRRKDWSQPLRARAYRGGGLWSGVYGCLMSWGSSVGLPGCHPLGPLHG